MATTAGTISGRCSACGRAAEDLKDFNVYTFFHGTAYGSHFKGAKVVTTTTNSYSDFEKHHYLICERCSKRSNRAGSLKLYFGLYLLLSLLAFLFFFALGAVGVLPDISFSILGCFVPMILIIPIILILRLRSPELRLIARAKKAFKQTHRGKQSQPQGAHVYVEGLRELDYKIQFKNNPVAMSLITSD